MSFLGSIGYIKVGSGLEDQSYFCCQHRWEDDVWSRVLKSYRSSHKPFGLLAKNIMDSVEFTDHERNEMDLTVDNAKRSAYLTMVGNVVIQDTSVKFH